MARFAMLIGYGSLAGVTIGFAIQSLLGASTWDSFAARSDVPAFYLGAHLVLTGNTAHLYDMDVQRTVHEVLIQPYGAVVLDPFVHPPWVALLFLPLAVLPFPWAFTVCSLVNLALAGGCARYWLRTTAHTPHGRQAIGMIILGCLPLGIALLLGQTPPLLVWLAWTGAVAAFGRGADRRAGAWLVLGLVKPQLLLGPLLAILAGRRWQTLVTFAAGAAAVGSVTLLAVGGSVFDYLRFLSGYAGAESGVAEIPWKMQNWRGLITHLLGTDRSPAALALIGGLTALSLGAVVWICWPRARPTGPGWDIRFAVATLLGLLANPHFYPYDAFLVLGPAFVLWNGSQGRRPLPAGARLRVLRGMLMVGPFVALLAILWPAEPVIQPGPWYLVVLLAASAWARPALGAPSAAGDIPA